MLDNADLSGAMLLHNANYRAGSSLLEVREVSVTQKEFIPDRDQQKSVSDSIGLLLRLVLCSLKMKPNLSKQPYVGAIISNQMMPSSIRKGANQNGPLVLDQMFYPVEPPVHSKRSTLRPCHQSGQCI